MREARVGEVAVALPELRRAHAHDASPSASVRMPEGHEEHDALPRGVRREELGLTSSSKNVSPVAPKRWA